MTTASLQDCSADILTTFMCFIAFAWRHILLSNHSLITAEISTFRPSESTLKMLSTDRVLNQPVRVVLIVKYAGFCIRCQKTCNEVIKLQKHPYYIMKLRKK